MSRVLTAAIAAVLLCVWTQGLAAPPAKLTPTEIQAAHRRALDLLHQKEYKQALEELQAILGTSPRDHIALYNAACACSGLGEKEEAIAYLNKALDAGFGDIAAMEKDSDLEGIRGEAGFKELARKAQSGRQRQIAPGVAQAKGFCAQKGIPIPGYVVKDDLVRNFVYLYDPASEEQAAASVKLIEGYAEYEWTHLFRHKPKSPLFIVLLSDADSLKTKMSFRGGYMAWLNMLMGTRLDGWTLAYENLIKHEFTHALTFADMWGRGMGGQLPAPIWFLEGLATLYEGTDFKDGKMIPRHNPRLIQTQGDIRAGRDYPWTVLMTMGYDQFMNPNLPKYAQSRYIMYYLYENGLLKKFIDEYLDNAIRLKTESTQEAVEVVFGKPLEVVEREWRLWMLKQRPKNVPRPGLTAVLKDGHVLVTQVRDGWPAQKAGITPGDEITEIDGIPTKTEYDVRIAELHGEVGDVIKYQILRNGRTKKFDVKLEKHIEPNSGRDDMPPELGMTFEEKGGQIVVTRTAIDSPWLVAGIKGGEVITAIDGTPVHTYLDVDKALRDRREGEQMALEVLRGGQKQVAKVAFGIWAEPTLNLPPRGPISGCLGITVEQKEGAVGIREVAPDSPAEKAGLQAGATLLEYNGKKVATVLEFFRAFRTAHLPGQQVTIKVEEGGKAREVTAELVGVQSRLATPIPRPLQFRPPAEVFGGRALELPGIAFRPKTPGRAAAGTLFWRAKGDTRFEKAPLREVKKAEGERINHYTAALPASATAAPFECYVEVQEAGEKPICEPPGGPQAPFTVVPDVAPPTAVSDLAAADVKSYRVGLRWKPATDDRTVGEYAVHRSTSDGFAPSEKTFLGKIPAAALEYVDDKPVPEKTAWYAVRAIDGVGHEGEVRYLKVDVPAEQPPRNGLTLTATPSSKSVLLTWSGEPDTMAAAFEICRGEGKDGPLAKIGETPDRKATQYLDKNAEFGKEYRYGIRPRSIGGLVGELGGIVTASPLRFLQRINCGGPEVSSDDGVAWEADNGKGHPTLQSGGTSIWTVPNPVTGTGPLRDIYQTERWANQQVTYAFKVDPGQYEVVLHFAETTTGFFGKGKRQFDIVLNGQTAAKKADIFGEAGGPMKPWRFSKVISVAGRELSVALQSGPNGPAIKGIEIRGLAPAGQ